MKSEFLYHLQNNILPYWQNQMTDPRGGLYGRRDGDGTLFPDAPKGAILHGRALWTFAAAYRMTGRAEYLAEAQRLKRYIIDHFVDNEFGGVYWSLNADGTPLDTRKQFYALGFVLYGMSELVRAAGDEEALQLSCALYHCIETHSRDRAWGGYMEAAARDWQEIADMRLSDKDANEKKTMNTHLHIIEPYTNLYRVWPDESLRATLKDLLNLFLDTIEDARTHHLGLFFNEKWERQDEFVSYGHDIEASWLLLETAQVLDDAALLNKTLVHTRAIALEALKALQPDGSMIYERRADGTLDMERHWWVQAEAVIGQVYLYRFHHMEEALDGARRTWQYIRENLIDPAGEWYWSRMPDGSINRRDDHAGFWKCPYHNGRMCMEVAACLE